ncbi:hypothetical protein E2C01_096137 [Portunus trituberculatus]|uniref:Uncharacterized protein n=1 Tax=Portunus trituberculatus TaxID=210409 RepID=A0A5B7K647_PORTR|nr:hypothetical protein [Portunus trituberculatus]
MCRAVHHQPRLDPTLQSWLGSVCRCSVHPSSLVPAFVSRFICLGLVFFIRWKIVVVGALLSVIAS